MTDKQPLELTLSEAVMEQLNTYEHYTHIPPAAYIEQLVEKTLPTLVMINESLAECGDDTEKMMELFNQKLAAAKEKAQQARESAAAS